ncbi:MAG: pentapeptide repeat-containing protein [bacterium]|nr:pentapeptide repeat-containing protein [bacterium]
MANLQGADLSGANLQKANLREAKLQGAKNLTASQVRAARNWDLAFYDDDFLKKYGKKLGLPQSEKEHTENVKKKLAELEKQEKEGKK